MAESKWLSLEITVISRSRGGEGRKHEVPMLCNEKKKKDRE